MPLIGLNEGTRMFKLRNEFFRVNEEQKKERKKEKEKKEIVRERKKEKWRKRGGRERNTNSWFLKLMIFYWLQLKWRKMER